MTSVNPLDCEIREGYLKQFTGEFPLRLGMDVAGEVVSIGRQIKHFRINDRVFAKSIYLPGGAYAQYILLPERVCSHIPATVDYDKVAGLPHAGLTALQGLRDYLALRPGESILINGGAGGVGHIALQLAKIMGANVTVTGSTQQIEWLTILGADKVINYDETALSSISDTYDCVFDVAGRLEWKVARALLESRGRYLTTRFSPQIIANNILELLISGKKVLSIIVRSSRMDLDYLGALIANQKLRVQIDKIFPLKKISQAHSYQSRKKGVGKILIKIDHKE
jgi:NADPH:quinone reductase-like Zn-dependent oxidoreductase